MEEFAFAFANSGEFVPVCTAWVALFIGGYLYARRPKFNFVLKRSSYTLLSGLVYISAMAGGVVYLASPEAMAGAYFFWIVVASHAIFTAVGYLCGIIAVARSLDAYGNRSRWYFCLIPLICLLLNFKPSLEKNKRGALSWIGAISMVCCGLFFFGLGRFIENKLETKILQRFRDATENTLIAGKIAEWTVQSQGLAVSLEQTARDTKTPQRVDEQTILTAVKATETSLEYTYTVSGDLDNIADALKKGISKHLCDSALQPLINMGARIKSTYSSVDGRQVVDVLVDEARCAEVADQA